MNPSLPISTGTGSMLDLGGSGSAPSGAGAGGDFNAMILQTSQALVDQSAAVNTQGQVPAGSGESLPPEAQQASVDSAFQQDLASPDVKPAVAGDETLRQLKKFLEADVSAEYSLIPNGNNTPSPSDETKAIAGLSAVAVNDAQTKAAAEQQSISSAAVPADQSPLSKAVHELVATVQSSTEGAAASGELIAKQNVTASANTVTAQNLASSELLRQQLGQTAQQPVTAAEQVSAVGQAPSQSSAAVVGATQIDSVASVAGTPGAIDSRIEGALANGQGQATIKDASSVVTQPVATPQADVPDRAVQQSTSFIVEVPGQNSQALQQLPQGVVESPVGKVVTTGQEGIVAQVAGVVRSDDRQAVSQQVIGAGKSTAEENGLIKGLVADNKAVSEGQKGFTPGGVSAGTDSLAKLQNSAFQLTEQLVDQAANKSSSKAVGSEVKLDSFVESLSGSLASTAAVRAEKVGAEPHQLQMQQGLKPGNPAWGQAVSDRVVWLASQNGKIAEIRLDPPELGSLNVKLEIKNDQVSVVFNTPHASVKESLEQSMPRLREMFAEQGLELADSSVDDQSSQQREDAQQREAAASVGYSADGEIDAESEVLASQAAQTVSLVDYYA